MEERALDEKMRKGQPGYGYQQETYYHRTVVSNQPRLQRLSELADRVQQIIHICSAEQQGGDQELNSILKTEKSVLDRLSCILKANQPGGQLGNEGTNVATNLKTRQEGTQQLSQQSSAAYSPSLYGQGAQVFQRWDGYQVPSQNSRAYPSKGFLPAQGVDSFSPPNQHHLGRVGGPPDSNPLELQTFKRELSQAKSLGNLKNASDIQREPEYQLYMKLIEEIEDKAFKEILFLKEEKNQQIKKNAELQLLYEKERNRANSLEAEVRRLKELLERGEVEMDSDEGIGQRAYSSKIPQSKTNQMAERPSLKGRRNTAGTSKEPQSYENGKDHHRRVISGVSNTSQDQGPYVTTAVSRTVPSYQSHSYVPYPTTNYPSGYSPLEINDSQPFQSFPSHQNLSKQTLSNQKIGQKSQIQGRNIHAVTPTQGYPSLRGEKFRRTTQTEENHQDGAEYRQVSMEYRQNYLNEEERGSKGRAGEEGNYSENRNHGEGYGHRDSESRFRQNRNISNRQGQKGGFGKYDKTPLRTLREEIDREGDRTEEGNLETGYLMMEEKASNPPSYKPGFLYPHSRKDSTFSNGLSELRDLFNEGERIRTEGHKLMDLKEKSSFHKSSNPTLYQQPQSRVTKLFGQEDERKRVYPTAKETKFIPEDPTLNWHRASKQPSYDHQAVAEEIRRVTEA